MLEVLAPMTKTESFDLFQLQVIFGDRIKERVPLARYTAARVGGRADALIAVNSKSDMVDVISRLWALAVPFSIIGGGSNILVSDDGVRGVVVYNRARGVSFNVDSEPPTVWAESGANLGVIARQAAARGLAGLEWAAGIPGTVGGAVYGNAGAHGSDISGSLLVAEILHQPENKKHDHEDFLAPIEEWPVRRLEYGYRTSILKRKPGNLMVLTGLFQLQRSTSEKVLEKIQEYVSYRQRSQPPGASMGSMFKNPPEDYAGRLIEAAGLKGTRIGDAEINTLHANFFINHGNATASDIYQLIELSRNEVADQFRVELELEIELVGEWL